MQLQQLITAKTIVCTAQKQVPQMRNISFSYPHGPSAEETQLKLQLTSIDPQHKDRLTVVFEADGLGNHKVVIRSPQVIRINGWQHTLVINTGNEPYYVYEYEPKSEQIAAMRPASVEDAMYFAAHHTVSYFKRIASPAAGAMQLAQNAIEEYTEAAIALLRAKNEPESRVALDQTLLEKEQAVKVAVIALMEINATQATRFFHAMRKFFNIMSLYLKRPAAATMAGAILGAGIGGACAAGPGAALGGLIGGGVGFFAGVYANVTHAACKEQVQQTIMNEKLKNCGVLFKFFAMPSYLETKDFKAEDKAAQGLEDSLVPGSYDLL